MPVMNSLECQLKRPHFNSVAGKRVKAKYKNSAGQSGDIYSHILIKREYNTLKNVYILIDPIICEFMSLEGTGPLQICTRVMEMTQSSLACSATFGAKLALRTCLFGI